MVQPQYTTRYGPKPKPLAERFWSKVSIPDDPNACWLWTGGHYGYGYGKLWLAGSPPKWVGAHRVSWELANGPIPTDPKWVWSPATPEPPSLQVLHSCDNPPCVNPAHLWLGTLKENTQDMVTKGRHAPPRGEHNGMAKLTSVHVQEIRQQYRQGAASLRRLSRDYGVAPSTIWALIRYKTWEVHNEQ